MSRNNRKKLHATRFSLLTATGAVSMALCSGGPWGETARAGLTWDANGTSPTNPTDGAGNWDLTSVRWSNGTTDSSWNNSTGAVATFGNNHGAGSAINVTTPIILNTLNFQPVTSGLYSLSGSSINLAGGAINANASASISDVITGTDGLTLAGTGLLALSGANTYTNGTTINSGTLVANSASAVNSNGLITVNGSAAALVFAASPSISTTINLQAGNLSVTAGQTLAMTGSIFNVSGGTLTVNGAVNDSSYGGTFNFSGGAVTGTVNLTGLYQTLDLPTTGGSGTFVLNTANASSYSTISTTIPTGTTVMFSPGGTSSLNTSSSATLTNNGTLTLTSANASSVTLPEQLINTGAFTTSSVGTPAQPMALTSAFNNSGTANFNTSTSITYAVANSGTINIANGATLNLNNGSYSYNQTAGALNINGTLNAYSAPFLYNGGSVNGTVNLNGSTPWLTLAASGISTGSFVISNGSSGSAYLYGTVLEAGISVSVQPSTTITLGGNGTLANYGTLNFTPPSGGTISWNTTTMNNYASLTVSGGAGLLQEGTQFTNETGGTATFNAPTTINNYASNYGAMTVGAGQTFSIGSSSYAFFQQAGTLTINGTLATNGGGFYDYGGTMSGTGTVNLNGATPRLIMAATGISGGTFMYTSSGAAALTATTLTSNMALIFQPTANATLTNSNSTLTNNGILTLASTGNAYTDTFSNSTLINNGTFTVSTPSLLTGKVTSNVGATANFNASTTLNGNFSTSGTLNIGQAVIFAPAAGVSFSQTAGTTTVATGSDLALNSSNAFLFNGGNITLQPGSNSVGSALLSITSLDYETPSPTLNPTDTASITTTSGATFPGRIDLNGGEDFITVNDPAATLTISASLIDGSIHDSGPGNLVLTGAEQISGTVDVSGMLTLGPGMTLANAVAFNVGYGSVLTAVGAFSSAVTLYGTGNFLGSISAPATIINGTANYYQPYTLPLNLTSGTVNFISTASPASGSNISGGTVGGPATVTVNGSLTINGGTIANTGGISVVSGTTLNATSGLLASGSRISVLTGGTLNLTNNFSVGSGATIYNVGGANTVLTGSGGGVASTTGSTFNNAGTFTSQGTGTWGTNLAFNNTGTFIQQGPTSGTPSVFGGTFNNSGSVSVINRNLTLDGGTSFAGSSFSFGSLLGLDNFTVNAGTTFTAPATATISFAGNNTIYPAWNFAGTTQVFSGVTTFNSAVNSLVTLSGTANFNGSVTVAPAINVGSVANFNSPISIPIDVAGGTANINATAGVVTGSTLSSGVYSVQSPGTLNFSANITSSAATVSLTGVNATAPGLANLTTNTGALTLSSGAPFTFSPVGGVFTNSGSLINAGVGTTTIPAVVTLNNTGTVYLDGGTLNVNGAVSQVTGSTLTGGTWVISDKSTLNFTALSITNNAAYVTLNGPAAQFTSLNALSTNTGTLNLQGGKTFTTAGPLTNPGYIYVGAGSTLTTTGLLTDTDGVITLYQDATAPGTLVLGGDVNFSPVNSTSVIQTGNLAGESAGIINLGGTTRTFTVNPASGTGGHPDGYISTTINNGSLVKAGNGMLLLAGYDTWSGTTSVLAGLLQLGGSNALPSLTDLSITSGATVNLGGYSSAIGSLAGSGSVLLGGANLTVGSDNNPTTFAGSIAGAGAFSKVGFGALTLSGSNSFTGGLSVNGGTLYLSGTNTFSGGISINSGTLAIAFDAALGSSTSNSIVLSSGGTLAATGSFTSARQLTASGGALNVYSGQTFTSTGGVVGSGLFQKTGGGELQLTTANSFSGPLVVAGGTLSLSGPAGAFPNVSSVDVQTTGTLELNSTTALGGNQTSNPQSRINDVAQITLDGGTVSLLGANGLATTEMLGQLIPSSAASTISLTPGTGTGSSAAVTFASLGTRSVGATVGFSGTNLGTTSQILFANTSNITGPTANTGGTIMGGWATANGTDFAKYVAGQGVVPFATGDYSINNFVTGSNVKLDPSVTNPPVPGTVGSVVISTLNINTVAAPVTLTQTGTLNLSSGGLIANSGSTSNPAVISGGTLTSGNGELDISVNGPGGLTINSLISKGNGGSFVLTERGTGILTLNNTTNNTPNNYGGFTIVSGTLQLDNPTNVTAVPGDLLIDGGTVTSINSGQLAATSNVTINSGMWNLNGQTENISNFTNNGGTMVFNHGTMSVSGTVTLSGGATTVASVFTGGTLVTVTGGVNTIGSGAVVTATTALAFAGINNPSVMVASDSASPGRLVIGTAAPQGSPSLSFVGSGTASIASTGTGSLAGVLDLSGDNTQFVKVSTGAVLAVSTQVTDGGLTLSGGGTLDLSAANNYAGGSVIGSSSTLEGDNPGGLATCLALGASGSAVTFGGTLPTLALRSDAPNTAYPYAIGVSASGISGTIDINRLDASAQTPAGTFTLNSMNIGSGNGSLSVTGSDGGTLAVGNVTLLYNTGQPGAAFLHTTANFSVNGTINTSGGSVDLIKDQAGTLTLGGTSANTFGNLTVNSGTVLLNKPAGVLAVPQNLSIISAGTAVVRLMASGQINSAASIAINAGAGTALLDLNGFSNTFGPIAFTSGGALNTSGGIATLTGNVSFTGSSGEAVINGNLNLSSSTPTFTIARGSAAADLLITANITGSGGGITKSGPGILYLQGTNTFTGSVLVNGGILQVDSDGNLGNASNTVTLNGGSLQSATALSRSITLTGAGGSFDVEYGNSVQLGTQLTGSGGFTKTGPGVFALTNASNNFTGGVSVVAGTLVGATDLSFGAAGGGINLAGGRILVTSSFTSARPLSVANVGGSINASGYTLTLTTDPSIAGTLTLAGGTVDFNLTGGAAAISGNATLQINPGATFIDAGSVDPLGGASAVNVNNNSVTSFDVTTGIKTAAAITGVGNTTVSASATLDAATIQQNVLTVNGSLAIANRTGPRATTVSIVSGLSIAGNTNAWTGSINLSNNDMIVHGGSLATITNQIASGFNATGAVWKGTGITSSAAANDGTHLTALGAILNSSAGNPIYGSATALGLFDGQNVTTTDVLIKYTYIGDANLDGTVDGSDYTYIDNGYLNHLTGWQNGDFNYDGKIDGSDYTLIDNAFETQGAPQTGLLATSSAVPTAQLASTGVVPEPASLAVLAAISVPMLARRRRLKSRP